MPGRAASGKRRPHAYWQNPLTAKKAPRKSPAKNAAHWGKYNSLFTRYIENNPKASPEEIQGFIDAIMEPVNQSWVSSKLDFLRPGTPGMDEAVRIKETGLEALAGPEKRKKGKEAPSEETKVIRGKTYIKINGKWYEQ